MSERQTKLSRVCAGCVSILLILYLLSYFFLKKSIIIMMMDGWMDEARVNNEQCIVNGRTCVCKVRYEATIKKRCLDRPSGKGKGREGKAKEGKGREGKEAEMNNA